MVDETDERGFVRAILWLNRFMISVYLLFLAPYFAAGQVVPGPCSAMAALALPSAKVTSADMSPAGGPIAGLSLSAKTAEAMPAFCRIKITDRPSPDSEINTEVWLPIGSWNGRFRGQGNGGFAGEIAYRLMATAVGQGYATAGTDTGHVGGKGDFAFGHPEKVKDFGWRAIHDMTVQAKQIVAAFYGKPAGHSYFAACSDGGREALMEAQRFPADYDGILAGAPAYHWTALVPSGTADTQALMASPANYIPASKLPAIAAAVRAQCDALDGVADGVLNDPRMCGFDPASIACKQGDAATCLTAEQVAALKTIYSAKLDDKGREVYPGFLPGAEEGPGGWALWITGYQPGKSLTAFFGQGYLSNFVYEKRDWDLKSFDFSRDLKAAETKTGAALDATEPNLTPFVTRGGKLILYHGWNDPAIPALGTIDYYDLVRGKLGGRGQSSWVRLYMVPGMQHCGGGPGATDFGQGGDGARGDGEHDIFTALEQWVEGGKAPGPIIAHGNGMTRPLCPYPGTLRYKGGDTKDAASFACVESVR